MASALLLVAGAWLLLAASIFNMLLLFWLGLTVFLTAEHRTLGLWLILGGIVSGSLFFACHTLILSTEIAGSRTRADLEWWWRMGWGLIISAPLLWYMVILWYSGFWNDVGSSLFQRHRLILVILVGYAASLLGLLIFSHALPTYQQVTVLYLAQTTQLGGVPLLLLLYPPYMLMTIILPMDALRHALPSHRMMGDLARQRSYQWLVRVSVVLLVVSLLVTGFLAWLMLYAIEEGYAKGSHLFVPLVGLFDLVITLLIALLIILLGQAVIAYEIFTGKVLPRRGFQRHWRNAIIVSSSLAGFISFSLLFQLSPIYSLLMVASTLMVFFALLSWRSFVHQDSLIQALRPFINQQGSAQQLFEVICSEMLHTQSACLLPMMPLLANQPIFFHTPKPFPVLSPDVLRSPQTPILALPREEAYQWALPLWSTRGLMGILFMGNKEGGGLYTQEEMEATSAGAERIIDLLIRETLGERVLKVERHRQVEQRVLDRQARRVLHDEILPDLHFAILSMAESPSRLALIAAHRKISDLIHDTSALPALSKDSPDVLKTLQALVQDELVDEFDRVEWVGAASLIITDELTREVVIHAAREVMRNAARHGRGEASQRKLSLVIGVESPSVLTITDDGVGQGQPWVKHNGGLALHSTMLAIVGGDLQVSYPSKGGTEVIIRLKP